MHMTATGDWTLHFNWGNTNNFAQVGISLGADGTLSGPAAGKWHEHDGRILLSFDTGPAKYGGAVSDKVSSGAMTTFGNLAGTWYMTKQGVVGAASELSNAVDAVGNAH
jgi:hypothetical protein